MTWNPILTVGFLWIPTKKHPSPSTKPTTQSGLSCIASILILDAWHIVSEDPPIRGFLRIVQSQPLLLPAYSRRVGLGSKDVPAYSQVVVRTSPCDEATICHLRTVIVTAA